MEDEEILSDLEQNEIAAFYQIPVRLIFGEAAYNGFNIRNAWRKLGMFSYQQ